jgi:signal transduction histidine kinase
MIPEEVGRLAPGTEQAIYRVVQEALHNVAKHAQAKNVTVQVSREGQTVQVVVEDDGIGIQARSNSRGHSFGLSGIKERIAMLGGFSRVVSVKGKGTRLEITVPASETGSAEGAPVRATAQAAARLN